MKISSKKLSCCVCLTDSLSKDFSVVEQHQLIKCHKCGLIYLETVTINPENFLADAALPETGSENVSAEYWGYPKFAIKYEKVFNHFFRERLKRLKEANPPEGEWLDIGSGFGLWQSFLKTEEIENSGIEIEHKAYQYSKSIRLNTDYVSIENFKSTKKFAVITMCDVLEHVEEPAVVLQKIKELLKVGGLLYIQVPNVMGLKIPYGDHLGLPHHLWQFSPGPLKELSKKSGFKIIKYRTGTQGVIKYHEMGGPHFYHKIFWKMGSLLKIGNRLQILLKNS